MPQIPHCEAACTAILMGPAISAIVPPAWQAFRRKNMMPTVYRFDNSNARIKISFCDLRIEKQETVAGRFELLLDSYSDLEVTIRHLPGWEGQQGDL